MSRKDRPASALPMRILLIASAVSAMAAAIVALTRVSEGRVASSVTASIAVVTPASEPIAMEALVFRTSAGGVAVEPSARRRGTVHLRTLARYRGLRAYPGAPPRIPHGLTAQEFRGDRCNTCHGRGGYSQRFEAYAPPTPHPAMANCLQCHVADAPMVGLPLPGPGPDALCRQCHAAATSRPPEPALDWRPAAWPDVPVATKNASPPPIPHDLQLRGNCLACHGGPAAVAELRTTHPERANCRQCHLGAGDEERVFVRPAPGADRARGAPL